MGRCELALKGEEFGNMCFLRLFMIAGIKVMIYHKN